LDKLWKLENIKWLLKKFKKLENYQTRKIISRQHKPIIPVSFINFINRHNIQIEKLNKELNENNLVFNLQLLNFHKIWKKKSNKNVKKVHFIHLKSLQSNKLKDFYKCMQNNRINHIVKLNFKILWKEISFYCKENQRTCKRKLRKT
jgi:hypothetical protein